MWAAYEAFERAAGLVQNADDVQARAAAAREAREGRQTLAAGAGAELPATGLLPGPLLAAGAWREDVGATPFDRANFAADAPEWLVVDHKLALRYGAGVSDADGAGA